MNDAGVRTTATRSSGAADPLAGMTIAGCKILRRIGNRAAGIVYDAQRLADAKRVALRLLAPESVAKDPTVVARFLRQGEALTQIRHAHLVRVHTTGEDVGFAYWIMDLVEGASLVEIVQAAGRMPWNQAALIMRHIVEAAAVAQDAGVELAGISPATVIITSSGDAKLVDQTLARILIKPPSQTQQPLLGVAFTPPEDLDPQAHPTPASVVYRLGATLYFAVTARPPYDGGDAAAISEQILERPVRPAKAHAEGLPNGADLLIQWTMERKPEQRPATPHELLTALDQAISRPDETGLLRAQKTPPTNWTPIIVCTAGLLVAALLAWLVLH